MIDQDRQAFPFKRLSPSRSIIFLLPIGHTSGALAPKPYASGSATSTVRHTPAKEYRPPVQTRYTTLMVSASAAARVYSMRTRQEPIH